jgi:hypothetical protein
VELVLDCMHFVERTCVSARGSVAVFDGPLVAVTPLRHTVKPPPLAVAKLEAGSAIVAAAWGERDGREVIAAVTAASDLLLCVAVEEDLWEETAEEMVGSTAVSHDPNPTVQVCSAFLVWRLVAIHMHLLLLLPLAEQVKSSCR